MIDDRILDEVGPEAVEAPRVPLPAAARKKSDQRRRAKRTMIIVTLACVALGSAPTAEQLIRHGWHAFVDRAPGVGGTASTPENPAAPVPQKPKASSHRQGPKAPRASSPLGSAPGGGGNQRLNTSFAAAVKPAYATPPHTSRRTNTTRSQRTFPT